jgi:hypothetical protein
MYQIHHQLDPYARLPLTGKVRQSQILTPDTLQCSGYYFRYDPTRTTKVQETDRGGKKERSTKEGHAEEDGVERSDYADEGSQSKNSGNFVPEQKSQDNRRAWSLPFS